MLPRMRVLLAEDDDGLRTMFRIALSAAGFHVDEARDGIAALRRIDADPPDAVILDIGLPLLSGVSVRKDLTAHAHTRDIPVLVVTGSTGHFEALNVNCVLRKPVSPEQVVDALRTCLQSGRSQRTT